MTRTARLSSAAIATSVVSILAGCSPGAAGTPADVSSPMPTAAATSEPSRPTDAVDPDRPTEDGSQLPAAPRASRPLSDFAEDGFSSFATPSGRIQCRLSDGYLACQTEEDPHAVDAKFLCEFYPGLEQNNAVRFGFFGEGEPPCATIIQGDGFISPHTLEYGQSVTLVLDWGSAVTCTSAIEGLTCVQDGQPGSRGFFLSTDSFTVL